VWRRLAGERGAPTSGEAGGHRQGPAAPTASGGWEPSYEDKVRQWACEPHRSETIQRLPTRRTRRTWPLQENNSMPMRRRHFSTPTAFGRGRRHRIRADSPTTRRRRSLAVALGQARLTATVGVDMAIGVAPVRPSA
jgi:hypothetical protein